MRPHGVPVRPGDLTLGWRVALVASWVGVFVAYLAVWKASEEMGLHTWWLGPRADPQPLVVRSIPFAVAVVMGTVAASQLRRLPLIGLGGAVVLAAIAVPDLPIAVGLALVEFTIAASVALVALASFTGLYRAAPGADTDER